MVDCTMGEYTQAHYDAMWDIMGRDYENDYDSTEVLEKLRFYLKPQA